MNLHYLILQAVTALFVVSVTFLSVAQEIQGLRIQGANRCDGFVFDEIYGCADFTGIEAVTNRLRGAASNKGQRDSAISFVEEVVKHALEKDQAAWLLEHKKIVLYLVKKFYSLNVSSEMGASIKKMIRRGDVDVQIALAAHVFSKDWSAPLGDLLELFDFENPDVRLSLLEKVFSYQLLPKRLKVLRILTEEAVNSEPAYIYLVINNYFTEIKRVGSPESDENVKQSLSTLWDALNRYPGLEPPAFPQNGEKSNSELRREFLEKELGPIQLKIPFGPGAFNLDCALVLTGP